jgi:hypothetical protein
MHGTVIPTNRMAHSITTTILANPMLKLKKLGDTMKQSENGFENEFHENQSAEASEREEMVSAMDRMPTTEDQRNPFFITPDMSKPRKRMPRCDGG